MWSFLQRNERTVSSVAVVVAALLLWELAVSVFSIRAFLLPPPSAIFFELWKSRVFFLTSSLFTLYSTALGFIGAVVLGLAMAIAIVYSKWLNRILYTLLVVLNSIPKVALAPVFVIWLGTGIEPKVAIALMIAIFSIVIDAVLGLRTVDPDMINLARAGRATPMQILLRIRLPCALPSIFSGMKVGVSFALVGAIVGEFVAGDRGLGSVILQAQGMFNTTRAFAAILLLGVLGTLLFFLVELAERKIIPWHVSQRGPAADVPHA